MAGINELSELTDMGKTDINSLLDGKHTESYFTKEAKDDINRMLGRGGNGGDETLIGFIEQTLTDVIIPDGVKIIGGGNFSGWENLESVIIPEGVTKIDNACFCDCDNLSSVILPNSLEIIGYSTFNRSNIKSIVIPQNVRGLYPFAFAYITTLTSVTILATMPPTLTVLPDNYYSQFYESNNAIFYVPTECVDTYKSCVGWSNFASRIQAIPNN